MQIVIFAVLGWSACLHGDVLTTNDGRVFEGMVHAEKDGAVQFDAVVSGIRARLSFDKGSIKSIEKKPLPESLADALDVEPGLSESQAPADAPTLYLEIPIKGRLKEQVFTQAIRSTLAYAKLHEVKHVVFTVDSTGGAVDEAGAIYRNLREFEKDIAYHAVITHCTGEAVVVPFLCKTIHLQPGASVGGSSEKMENLPSKYVTKDEEYVRAQIAEDLAEVARQRGRKGEIIKAMVDPAITLAAWVDEKGEMQLDRTPPKDLPADRLIFADGPDQVLVLSFEQATRLGVPAIQGGAAELGPRLGIEHWREESAYGRNAMNKAIAARNRKENSGQAKSEDAISRNIRMREITLRAVETNLQQAALWNPTPASYQALSRYWSQSWSVDSQWDVRLWTPENRQKWSSRAEACASFLTKARIGVESMIRLDKEAVSLGLSPSFKEGDLQAILDDVDGKQKGLAAAADRAGN